jgi:hypothetical protein
VSARDTLNNFLDSLPEQRLREILDFAEFLSAREEDSAWQQFGQTQLARAYGPDEPEYSLGDLKRGQ